MFERSVCKRVRLARRQIRDAARDGVTPRGRGDRAHDRGERREASRRARTRVTRRRARRERDARGRETRELARGVRIEDSTPFGERGVDRAWRRRVREG